MTGQPYSDWEAFYESFDFPSLIAEGGTLPDSVSVNQFAAYLVRLIEIACDDPDLAGGDRTKAAQLAGSVEDNLRNGLAAQDPAALKRFEQALAATLSGVNRFALFPDVAQLIASGAFTATRK